MTKDKLDSIIAAFEGSGIERVIVGKTFVDIWTRSAEGLTAMATEFGATLVKVTVDERAWEAFEAEYNGRRLFASGPQRSVAGEVAA